jgi:hypothetical protein
LAAEKANNKDSTEEEVNEEGDDEEEKDGDDDDEKDGDDVDEVAERDDAAENENCDEEIKEDKADVEIEHANVAKEGAGDVEKLGDNEKKSPEEVETDDAPLEKDA